MARLAEQLGATADDPAPACEAAEFVRRWRGAGFMAPVAPGEWTLEPFYAGRSAMAFARSNHPFWAFAQPEFTSFAWGIVPEPRVRRSDSHVTYWQYRCTAVRATAPDPVAAFAVIAAIVSEGPLSGGSLPDYRTPEVMREWNALPWPLGKECLLALDAETDPLSTPPHLWWEAIDAFEALADGSVDLHAGMTAVRAHIAERAATGRRGSLLKKYT